MSLDDQSSALLSGSDQIATVERFIQITSNLSLDGLDTGGGFDEGGTAESGGDLAAGLGETTAEGDTSGNSFDTDGTSVN